MPVIDRVFFGGWGGTIGKIAGTGLVPVFFAAEHQKRGTTNPANREDHDISEARKAKAAADKAEREAAAATENAEEAARQLESRTI